ncbi:MAG TPA: hypothetical protein VG033_12130, partial [Candidatus Acidoferrales bacterium]|nr:hypothetical protein [Candidatus Acidoferrales bacterium]
MRKSISCLALTLLSCAAADAQQESRQGVAQRSATETPARVSVRSPDIISDNLDRVAASADQILEVLNREAGLMVELKRLLAQDAGASGQILEESDLTDSSVVERLNSDVRARVLATRLLQRYGYLVPRLNPDSDLEAEQKLVRQERAQLLARAADRRDTLGEGSAAGRNAACNPRSVPECVPPEDRESPGTAPATPTRAPHAPAPPQQAEDLPQNDVSRPDGTTVLPNQRPEYSPSGGAAEAVLTSGRPGTNPQLSVSSRAPDYGTGDNLSDSPAAQPDLQPPMMLHPEEPARNATPASSAAEPVRMVRQPNPYADVPSLYDLYVQAASSARPVERFGLDVFRKGEANPAYLPMDLPVGPDYVVG